MNNNKQQTAVEQLISKIPLGMRMQLAELGVDFEQAKEMEKEQMDKVAGDWWNEGACYVSGGERKYVQRNIRR